VRVTCHALEPGGGLRPEAELAAVAGWRAGGGPYWVDLSGDRPEEALGWLGGLGLDPAVLDALQIGDDSPRILPLAESVFLAYPVAAADDAGTEPVRCAPARRLWRGRSGRPSASADSA